MTYNSNLKTDMIIRCDLKYVGKVGKLLPTATGKVLATFGIQYLSFVLYLASKLRLHILIRYALLTTQAAFPNGPQSGPPGAHLGPNFAQPEPNRGPHGMLLGYIEPIDCKIVFSFTNDFDNVCKLLQRFAYIEMKAPY